MSQRINGVARGTMSNAQARTGPNACEWCAKPCSQKCSKCERAHVCSRGCFLKFWPTHRYMCGKPTGVVGGHPKSSPVPKKDVQAGERHPDYWRMLPAGVQRMLPQYMDVQSLCGMDTIMLNVLGRKAWNDALRGMPSMALSKWPRYSSLDKFKGLRWSLNRRVALEGITIHHMVAEDGRVIAGQYDQFEQFEYLCKHSKLRDIACLLVESKSIDANLPTPGLQQEESNLLVVACQYNDVDVVKALLNYGADVNKAVSDNVTPLYQASLAGNVDVVNVLLRNGADVHKASSKGMTPLFIASQSGHQAVVRALLDTEGEKGDETPLTSACFDGKLAVVQALLRAGADVDEPTLGGLTPLYMAALNGHTQVVQTLIQAGAAVDKGSRCDGATPLMLSSELGCLDIVQALLAVNSNPNLGKKDGGTPLYLAAMNNQVQITKALLHAGANPEVLNMDGDTPLLVSVQRRHLSTVLLLLKEGRADVNHCRASDGTSPLAIAVADGNQIMVRALLQAGANPNTVMDDGFTSLLQASNDGHADIVRALLQANAEVDYASEDNGGCTALLAASEEGHDEVVRALLHGGADPDKAYDDGETPLFLAIKHNKLSVLQALLHGGADVNKSGDDEGTSPLTLAEDLMHHSIINALVRAGAEH